LTCNFSGAPLRTAEPWRAALVLLIQVQASQPPTRLFFAEGRWLFGNETTPFEDVPPRWFLAFY
jgi:hypothetical protein